MSNPIIRLHRTTSSLSVSSSCLAKSANLITKANRTSSQIVLSTYLSVWQRRKRRQGWKGRQSADLQESTPISFVQGWTPVPRRTCSPFPQELGAPGTSCGSYSSCIHVGDSGILDRRSIGIGWKCLQGLESQAYHTSSLAVGDSWRRRIGCSY